MKTMPCISLCLVAMFAAPLHARGDGYDGLTAAQWAAKLQDEDKQVRRRAAYALGQIGPDATAAVPALAVAADDTQLEVGWYALDALGRIGPAAKTAVPDIVRIVEKSQKYPVLRLNGIRALGKIGRSAGEAAPMLERFLTDADRQLAVAAALSLWQIDGREAAVSALAAELSSQDPDVGLAAAMALVEIGPGAEPASRALIRALGHPNADVRRAAGRALSRIGTSQAELIAKALDYRDRFDAVSVVNTLGWMVDDARQQVLHNPQTSVDRFRATAVTIQKQVVDVLLPLMGNADAEIRSAATTALARCGPMVIPAALTALDSENSRARAAAAATLAELERYLPPDTRQMAGVEWIKQVSLQKLMPVLGKRDPTVRRAAFRLFDALRFGPGAAAAIPALRAGQKDEDALVRRYASRSIDRIESTTPSEST